MTDSSSDPDPIPTPTVDDAASAGDRDGDGGGIAVALSEPCALWRGLLADPAGLCAATLRAACAAAAPALAAAEISLVLADDAFVRTLNRDWRGKDRPTNVLSFAALDDVSPDRPPEAPPASDEPLLLGDIVLAFETVAAEAAAQGKPFADHLRHLLVHGLLHLLGYDHETNEEDAQRMEALETRILAGFGIPDPYVDRAGAGGIEAGAALR